MTRHREAEPDEPRDAIAPDRPPSPTSDASKDVFFERVATLADEMIDRHGKDFAMGTLVLAARFIAEDKPLSRRGDGAGHG